MLRNARPSPETQLDALSERVVEMALSPAVGARGLVSAVAAAHPEATLLDVAAAIARAAVSLEEAGAGAGEDRAAHLHRIAALATIDAWTAARRGWTDVRMGDLALYRRIHGSLRVEAPAHP